MSDTMFDAMFGAAIAGGGSGAGFTPTETQLTAMNSGIDSEKVQQIETNKTNISNIKQVPSVGSSDNGKVLTATYENGVGSYSWQAAGGGGSKKYLYQINVTALLETVSTPIKQYRLRSNLSLISDDPNLSVTETSIATFEQKYLIYSGTSGYVHVCNISNITIAEGEANSPFELVSYVRKNLATNRYYFQTSNTEYELKLVTSSSVYLSCAKTEI